MPTVSSRGGEARDIAGMRRGTEGAGAREQAFSVLASGSADGRGDGSGFWDGSG